MEELRKVAAVVRKVDDTAPHEVLLVLDATTGQNGLSQARLFDQAADLSGVVLTKVDGTAKGGIAMAIRRELDVPVKLVGSGEKLEDLQPFDAQAFARALFAPDE
jgi:fused signal recognition particle receptor